MAHHYFSRLTVVFAIAASAVGGISCRDSSNEPRTEDQAIRATNASEGALEVRLASEAPEERPDAPVLPPNASKPISPSTEKDDADAPSYLLDKDTIGPWMKTAPVRVAQPGEWASRLGDGQLIAALEQYSTQFVATVTFTRANMQGEDTASALVVQTLSPEDAYGLFSIQPGDLREASPEVRTKLQNAPRLMWHGWKGRCYVRITLAGERADELAEDSAELLPRIVERIPASPLPNLLSRLPTGDGLNARVWMVRTSNTLRQIPGVREAIAEEKELDQRLGLDKSALMVVAAYREGPPEGNTSERLSGEPAEPPNYVWLVKYPSAAKAKEAHRRYKRELDALAKTRPINSIIFDPQREYVMGTWTADQESIMNVLPRLVRAIPEK